MNDNNDNNDNDNDDNDDNNDNNNNNDHDTFLILRDDSYIRFWQRNRPGDREELDGNSVATLRSTFN